MKQRFSSLDIKVIAHELSQSLTSLRVVNIYDLSTRIFLFKFAKPDHREQFVIESGFRCHLTSFARTTAAAPSSFVARLRKCLKTRRVTCVQQVGTDRILELQFSDGLYRLFLEFYAGGNIVLTDKELNVIGLLRTVNEGAEHEHVRPGSVYNLSARQNVDGVPPISDERVKNGLQAYIDKMASWGEQAQAKKGKKRSGDVLRKALASCMTEFPPLLLEHGLQVANVDPQLQPQDVVSNQEQLDLVVKALQEADRVVQEVMSKPVGHIIARRKAQGEADTTVPPKREDLLYDDYYPFVPKQFQEDKNVTVLDFDSFNKAVDDFYSSIEGQKLESKLQEKEDAAKKKLEHAKQDQERRIGALQTVQEMNVRKAQAIEANLERVEEATAAINGLIAQGMDWVEIDRVIELEQKRQNPVAEMIKLPLKLNENTATLLLAEWAEDVEEDEGDVTDEEISDDEEDTTADQKKSGKTADKKAEDRRLTVDIDLALSAYSNARDYYEQRRNAAAKQEKTVQAADQALKSAQQKIERDLKKQLKQEKAVLQPIRKQFWFEKFSHFISSDGYLVLGAKDAMQAEILYKKHLKKNDVFVHADLNNAQIVIIKNNATSPDAVVPPSTLSQAGNLSIATSTAWDSKAVMSAWWVPGEQVSKTAPTGDFMQPGTFHIKGKKNFLPPAQLLLGFAIMFQISEESKARHTKHRVGQPLPIRETAEEDKEDPSMVTVSQHMGEHEDQEAHEDEDDEDVADETADEDEGEDDYVNPLNTQSTARKDASDQDDEHSEDKPEDERAEPDAHPETSEHTEDPNDTPATTNAVPSDTASETASDSELSATHPAKPGHATPSNLAKPSSTKPSTTGRGKRGKAKKIAQKYADQDDEDRAIAMSLLGSRAGAEKAAAEAEAKQKAREEAEAAKQRRREQAERAQQKGRERELKRIQESEAGAGGDEGEDDDAGEAAVDLDTLIGAPLVGDEILLAVPICAPWSALGKYKYKAKLQPGSTKKGKAVREILGKWDSDAKNKRNVDERSEDTDRIWPREAEMISMMKEREEHCFGVVPVKGVRVMMGGGKGGGGSAKAKGGGRGGRGSKKAR